MKRLAALTLVLAILAMASVAFAENGPKFGTTSLAIAGRWTQPER